jgi:hypothetical protein
MFVQIAIGSALMLLTIVITGISYWVIEVSLLRWDRWLRRKPHAPRLVAILCAVSLWIMMQLSLGVWLWAGLYMAIGVFDDLETTLYFTVTAYTTLGFGDVLAPQEWRLLGGMAAANGLLNFGLLTAVLVETLRQVRRSQADAIREAAH